MGCLRMIYFDSLCCGLEAVMLSRSFSAEGIEPFHGLMLPDADGPVRSDIIYVGSGEQIAALLRNTDPEGSVTAFCAGPLPEGISLPAKANVASCGLPLPALLNRLSESVARLAEWEGALSAVLPGEDYPLHLLQCAAALTGCSFFLIDSCFNIVASGQSVDKMSDITQPDTPQRLSPAQINKLFGQLLIGGVPTEAADIYQISYRMHPLRDQGRTLGHLLIAGADSDGWAESFSYLLSKRLAPCLRAGGRAFEAPEGDPFRLFIERMYVQYRQNPRLLMTDMRKLPIATGPWVRFLIISFENSTKPLSELFPRVNAIFAQSNVTIYDNKIVVLLSFRKSARVDEKECGLDDLEELLQAHDGFAILSNACTLEKGIRTEYIQCREVLDMIPKLRLEGDKRCARLNRYLGYYTIHLCASHLMEEFGHDRLVYFAYPEILNLTRYGMQNNTDLRDFLFYYVMNDCNVTQTAKFLHMHRNTVLYKLNRIKELAGISLDASVEKIGILHSCQVLRYMERVQNQQASLLDEAIEYTPKH